MFAEVFPWLSTFYTATPMGEQTIPGYFDLPYGLVVFAVVLMAVGGFWGAHVDRATLQPGHAGGTVTMAALPRLTRNQQLAALALILGVVAIPARPYSGTTVTFDTRELATEVAREADHVNPLDVADWIIKGRSDYRLVDIRSEAEYGGLSHPHRGEPPARHPDGGASWASGDRS